MHVLFVVVDRALALAAVRDAFVLVIQGVELRESELLDRQRIVIIPCVTKEDVNDSVGLERGGTTTTTSSSSLESIEGVESNERFWRLAVAATFIYVRRRPSKIQFVYPASIRFSL